VTFFAIIRDAMRETLAGAWSDAFEAAWAKLLDEIHQFADATPRIDVDRCDPAHRCGHSA